MAVSTVLETQKGLGQSAPIRERGEGTREWKGRTLTSPAKESAVGGHSATWTQGSQSDEAQIAALAETDALGDKPVAPGTARRP
jgi:hypothetical protein